jgi:hypothetical protein
MSYGYTWNSRDTYDSYYTYQDDSPFYIPPYNDPNNSASAQATSYAATAHEYGNDDAYHSGSGDNDYASSPCPEPHEEQARRAAEYGLTPQELHEISQDCIREQELLEQEYQEEMREAREARREAMRAIEELGELEYEQQEELVDQTQVGTYLPVYNHEQEPPGDWVEDQDRLPPRMPTPTTVYEPEYDVYEAYGTADEPPEAATSPYDDAWLNDGTPPLDREQVPYGHETPPPSWEHTTEANPGYDDEPSAHGIVHGVYHAVEPHVDDAVSFEHEHPSLWHEMQAVDGEWAADHEGGPELYEELATGMYVHPNYIPPPSPTPWRLPQPLNPGFTATPNHSRPPPPHIRYQGHQPRAPRHRYGYRPRYTTSTPRERYRRPRLTIGDVYGKRGLRIPLSQPDREHEAPTRPSTPSPPLRSLSNETQQPNQGYSTLMGCRRDRPPHPHPIIPIRSRSDSPDWREARPGRPISFKTPPSTPTNPNTTLELLPEPIPTPKPALISLGTSNLSSLVTQASTALQSIITIVQKLTRRVNAERRIAHRSSVVGLECARGRARKRASHSAPHVSSSDRGTCGGVNPPLGVSGASDPLA